MNVLILGGTRFVSKAIAQSMIEVGHQTSIFTRGYHPVDYSGLTNIYTGNRRSQKDLESALKGQSFDYILDISGYIPDDITALISLLDLTRLKRYIFLSSGTVYKESSRSVCESYPRGFNPNWGNYGLGKMAIENYLLDLHKNQDFPVIILRPTYIYGEGNNLYRESYIFERGLNKLLVPLPPGNEKNQFIHIDDVIQVIQSCLQNDAAIGQAYNITHPDIFTWEEWIDSIIDATRLEIEYKCLSTPPDFLVREYFPFRNCNYLLNTQKLQKDGIYQPQIALKEGIAQTFDWYKNTTPKLCDQHMNKIDLALTYI